MSPQYLLVFACLWGIADTHPAIGNLAATIRATQSSLSDFLGDAANAIDGNNNTDRNVGSCSRTKVENSPWFKVDLFYHYKVYTVRITISSAGDGLRNAEIRIGDSETNNSNDNPICARIENITRANTAVFNCAPGGVHGRFLNIIVPGRTVALELCEVEAFGTHDPH
ncbi:fucolectin-1-like [Heterodontus francisci]|uniref:fucolectin-1-like n=1 Tax=Heterodontus francisci TaxID=7792 RepID=UPI00355BD85C